MDNFLLLISSFITELGEEPDPTILILSLFHCGHHPGHQHYACSLRRVVNTPPGLLQLIERMRGVILGGAWAQDLMVLLSCGQSTFCTAVRHPAVGTALVQVLAHSAQLRVRQNLAWFPSQSLGVFLCLLQCPKTVVTGSVAIKCIPEKLRSHQGPFYEYGLPLPDQLCGKQPLSLKGQRRNRMAIRRGRGQSFKGSSPPRASLLAEASVSGGSLLERRQPPS